MLLTITPVAECKLQSLLAENPSQHICVSLNNKGCSGHSYDWKLISEDQIQKFDHQVNLGSGKFVIRANSVLKLWGSTLDHVADHISEQFVWNNPNVTVTCGCGHSVGFEETCK